MELEDLDELEELERLEELKRKEEMKRLYKLEKIKELERLGEIDILPERERPQAIHKFEELKRLRKLERLKIFKKLRADVLLLGFQAPGKTCLIEKFIFQRFPYFTRITYTTYTLPKTIQVDDILVEMWLWDFPTCEKLIPWAFMMCGDFDVSIVMFDLTYRGSYDDMHSIVKILLDKYEYKPIYIVGNKCDLPNRQVLAEEAREYCRHIGAQYFETSVLTGEGVDTLFDSVVRDLIVDIQNPKQFKPKSCFSRFY